MVQILVLLSLVGCIPFIVKAHMQMKSPFPRRSPFNPNEPDKDYNIMAPLEPHSEFKFPCRGASAGPTVSTITPGKSFPVTLFGSATHNGGHCQFSISYDGGHTFAALHTILNRCMLDGLNFNIPIPNNLPSGKAVFAWTWINASGKREMYMNCADVTVNRPVDKSYPSGKTFKGPQIVVANIPGAVTIGEFGAGADPRTDLYQNQPIIVIGPGINSSYSAYTSPSSAPTSPAVHPESTSTTTTNNKLMTYKRISVNTSLTTPSEVNNTDETTHFYEIPPTPNRSAPAYDQKSSSSSSSSASYSHVINKKPRNRKCHKTKRIVKHRVPSPSYPYAQGKDSSHPSELPPPVEIHTYMYR